MISVIKNGMEGMRVSAPPREQWGDRVCECAAGEEEYQSAAAWCGGKGVCVGAHISARSSFFVRELPTIV